MYRVDDDPIGDFLFQIKIGVHTLNKRLAHLISFEFFRLKLTDNGSINCFGTLICVRE
jgi:hypothetical protein